MTTPIPLRDYPVVRQDPILAALFEELRAKLRSGDVPMVSERAHLDDFGQPIEWADPTDYRVWVSHNSPGSSRTFGPRRPTLAQAIDGLIAKLR